MLFLVQQNWIGYRLGLFGWHELCTWKLAFLIGQEMLISRKGCCNCYSDELFLHFLFFFPALSILFWQAMMKWFDALSHPKWRGPNMIKRECIQFIRKVCLMLLHCARSALVIFFL